jgi:hypothetical protein
MSRRFRSLLLLLCFGATSAAAQDITLLIVSNRTSLPVTFSTKPHIEHTVIEPGGFAVYGTQCAPASSVCWGAKSDTHSWGFTDATCVPCGGPDRFDLTEDGWHR